MDTTAFILDFYKSLAPNLVWPLIQLFVLLVLVSVLKVLTAKKRAQEQVQRDIERAIYRKEIDRIAQRVVDRRHSLGHPYTLPPNDRNSDSAGKR